MTPYAKAAIARRQSGAAGPMIPRNQRRQSTRKTRNDKAIKEQS
jgi:hypothetical protein